MLQKLQKSKEKSLNLKSSINRIFTPESITLHEIYDMSRKASPSVLLHKIEVTYIQKLLTVRLENGHSHCRNAHTTN